MALTIDSIEPTSPRLVATETFHTQAVRGSWFAQLQQHNLLPPTAELTTQICFEAGKRLAQIHELGKEFPLPLENPWPLHKLQSLNKQLEKGQLGSHSQLHTLAQQMKLIADRPPYVIPEGMTHGDYTPNQALGQTAACKETFLYDLATALNGWGFDETGMFRASWFHAVLSGYESIRSLRRDERRLFNLELRRAAVRNCILLTFESAPEDVITSAFEILHYHATRHEMASYV